MEGNPNRQSRAKDYYDLPVDLLPSANFAGGPASDISMLDGLWTIIMSSASSSDDDEDGPVSSQPSPKKPPPAAQSLRGTPGNPDVPEEGFFGNENAPRIRSLSNDVKIMERPWLPKKTHTAPPDTTFAIHFTPPESRRASIARLEHVVAENETVFKAPPIDIRYENRADTETSGDARPEPKRPLPSLPTQGNGADYIRLKETPRPQPSFSQSPRVSKKLKDNKMGKLSISVVKWEVRRGPDSATSMVSTPRELYAVSKRQSRPDTTLRPLSLDRRTEEAITPGTCPPSRPTYMVRAPQPSGNGGDDARLADVSRQQRVYLPGKICFEDPVLPRRDSVATLDHFVEPSEKNNEMIMEEDIVVFFEDFNVVAEVTDMTLDKYWMRESHNSAPRPPSKEITELPSIIIQESSLPAATQSLRSPRGSKFSFSSGSSAESAPGTPKRPRNRLVRMWTPGLPGSAFLKSPALWGQQNKRARQARQETE